MYSKVIGNLVQEQGFQKCKYNADIWYVFATLYGCGVESTWFERPSFRGKVVVMATWLFASTVLILSYNNVLLSILMTAKYERPIDTVDDMLQHDGRYPDTLILTITSIRAVSRP